MSFVASPSPVWASEEEQWIAPVDERSPEATAAARARPAENDDPLAVADVAVFALGPKLIERPTSSLDVGLVRPQGEHRGGRQIAQEIARMDAAFAG